MRTGCDWPKGRILAAHGQCESNSCSSWWQCIRTGRHQLGLLLLRDIYAHIPLVFAGSARIRHWGVRGVARRGTRSCTCGWRWLSVAGSGTGQRSPIHCGTQVELAHVLCRHTRHFEERGDMYARRIGSMGLVPAVLEAGVQLHGGERAVRLGGWAEG